MNSYEITIKSIHNYDTGISCCGFMRVDKSTGEVITRVFAMKGGNQFRSTIYAIMASIKGLERPFAAVINSDDSNILYMIDRMAGVAKKKKKIAGVSQTLKAELLSRIEGCNVTSNYRSSFVLLRAIHTVDKTKAIPDDKYWDEAENEEPLQPEQLLEI